MLVTGGVGGAACVWSRSWARSSLGRKNTSWIKTYEDPNVSRLQLTLKPLKIKGVVATSTGTNASLYRRKGVGAHTIARRVHAVQWQWQAAGKLDLKAGPRGRAARTNVVACR